MEKLSIAYCGQCVQVEHGAYKHYDRHDYDDAAHHLVDDLYAVGVEHGAYLVHEPRQSVPPQQRAAYDAHVAGAHLYGMVGDDEGKLGEEAHHEHYD